MEWDGEISRTLLLWLTSEFSFPFNILRTNKQIWSILLYTLILTKSCFGLKMDQFHHFSVGLWLLIDVRIEFLYHATSGVPMIRWYRLAACWKLPIPIIDWSFSQSIIGKLIDTACFQLTTWGKTNSYLLMYSYTWVFTEVFSQCMRTSVTDYTTHWP